MNGWAWLFWIGCAVVVYTYVGYGFLVYLWVKWRCHVPAESAVPADNTLPAVTLVVAAYNEACIARQAGEFFGTGLSTGSSRYRVCDRWFDDDSEPLLQDLPCRQISRYVYCISPGAKASWRQSTGSCPSWHDAGNRV